MTYLVRRVFKIVQTVEVSAPDPETALKTALPRFDEDSAPDVDVDSYIVEDERRWPCLKTWPR